MTKKLTTFRFEAAWTKDPSCKQVIIKDAWNESIEGLTQQKCSKKLKNTKTTLKKWNRTV